MDAVDDDPEHSILPNVHLWDLVEFTFRHDPIDNQQSFIDMVFCQDRQQQRLRFFAPQLLKLNGIPSSFGMCILDVSGRQLEDLRVRIANFEGHSDAPRFWAKSVVKITDSDYTTEN